MYLKRKVVFSIEASDYDSGSREVYYKLTRALMEECGDGNFSATKVTNHGFYDEVSLILMWLKTC